MNIRCSGRSYPLVEGTCCKICKHGMEYLCSEDSRETCDFSCTLSLEKRGTGVASVTALFKVVVVDGLPSISP